MPSDSEDPVRRRAVARLREAVAGPVVVPGEDGYDTARRAWNLDRLARPAVIIGATTVDDVTTAVRFARGLDLPLAVRGGGYSPDGLSARTGGVMIDLRRMNAVRVDAGAQRITVGAGARWGDVDHATQRFGFAVPGAAVASIGVAGSTLTGGFGHLRRAYGLACDNLVSARLVSADARSIDAGGDLHPELLWGLRGGGGNFGVATSMTFRLRSLPQPVLCGALFFAADSAPQILRFYRDWTHRMREDVTTGVMLYGSLPAPLARRLGGERPAGPILGVSVVSLGHPADAEAIVRPLRAAGPVLADLLAPRPYATLQTMPDSVHPPGTRAVMDSGYLDALDDDLIDTVVTLLDDMPSDSCEMHLQHMGGAVGRVARMSTAVPNRGAPYLFSTMARWLAQNERDRHEQWHAQAIADLAKHSVGGPHVGMHTAAVSSVETYGAERYLRLAALKRSFDPDNVFAGNQNVTPLV